MRLLMQNKLCKDAKELYRCLDIVQAVEMYSDEDVCIGAGLLVAMPALFSQSLNLLSVMVLSTLNPPA